jgi:hypothetical protein
MVRGLSRSVQVALVLLAPGFALLAQHAGHVGSMSPAHVGGGLHAGPPPSFSMAPRSFAPLSGSQIGHWPSSTPNHRPNNGHGGHGGVGYRFRYPTVYAGYPWLNSFGYGLPLAYGAPYGDDQDDAPPPQQADYGGQSPVDYGPEAPGPEVAANASPPFRPAYPAPVEAAPVHPQPATTLIFKDGRPPAQVHNYALTGSTLYALDGESRQEIPLSLLNVPATVEANRAVGVDFALPISK